MIVQQQYDAKAELDNALDNVIKTCNEDNIVKAYEALNAFCREKALTKAGGEQNLEQWIFNHKDTNVYAFVCYNQLAPEPGFMRCIDDFRQLAVLSKVFSHFPWHRCKRAGVSIFKLAVNMRAYDVLTGTLERKNATGTPIAKEAYKNLEKCLANSNLDSIGSQLMNKNVTYHDIYATCRKTVINLVQEVLKNVDLYDKKF